MLFQLQGLADLAAEMDEMTRDIIPVLQEDVELAFDAGLFLPGLFQLVLGVEQVFIVISNIPGQSFIGAFRLFLYTQVGSLVRGRGFGKM